MNPKKLFLLTVVFLYACADKSNEQALIEFDINAVEQDYSAHWLRQDTIVLNQPAEKIYLLASQDGTLDNGEKASMQVELSAIERPLWLSQTYPHLTNFYAYKISLDKEKVKSLLTQQLAVLQLDEAQQASRLSYVQLYGLLDHLFTAGSNDADESEDLGAIIKSSSTAFSIWAPTAKAVSVRLFDANKTPLPTGNIKLEKNHNSGIWSVTTSAAPEGTFYQYELALYHPATKSNEVVVTTDPYSLSLSTNSEYSQVVDLNSPSTQPKNWFTYSIPTVAAPEANILYEMHIRDFSAHDQSLSSPEFAGKYKAFGENNSDGVKHLKALRTAGLNNLHLLPTYDITTVNEDPNQVVFPKDALEKICRLKADFSLCDSNVDPSSTLQEILESQDPMGSEAQALVEQLRTLDPYNWGYDPFHYTVPEGSYAINPDGISRIVEFREMVQNIHQMGFRVIMDVVYNHTYASGLSKQSVLDKVVPNYYHRLHPITGAIEQSTCCDNTATEHKMMAKLMIDSLVVWARDYKIDGFRFDLMGHQPKDAMLAARDAVRIVDPDTYFYGEGWNFGEVANNAQFVQATQLELAGTEIGTFTDRLRDAIRGGSSFVSKEAIRQGQGIGNGLIGVPNELQNEQNQASMLAEYYLSKDQIRVGLAANLANFPLQNAAGEDVSGKDIDYGGGPTGYALDPADTVNYVSKHDNQTLWDNNQYRIANEVSIDDRVRMQILSLSYPMLSQGIPFIHMGSELLRSKSFLRDSYDFGDWFNKVDFSKQSNNYNVGLPPADKDKDNWEIITKILKGNDGRDIATQKHIKAASERFMDLLAIRTSTPLFSLTSAEQVIERVKFHNTGPEQQSGLIVMSISDPKGENDLDDTINNIVVIFNNSLEKKHFDYPQASSYSLHPRLQNSTDPIIKTAISTDKGFEVPALSVAVFKN